MTPLPKYILPPPCLSCSDSYTAKKYEQGLKTDKNSKLVLTRRISDYEYYCDRCTWSRPDPIKENDGVTKLWFVSCKNCGKRHISPEVDKCTHCDLGLV